MDSFSLHRFESRVQKALTSVERILSITRHPSLPSSVSHQYIDKYHLAEFVTNTAIAALSSVFEKGFRLGDSAIRSLVIRQSQTQSSATLRFDSVEKCEFVKEATRNVESSTTYVTETSSSLFGNSKRTDKVITKVTEYFWNFNLKWDISILDASGSVTRLHGGSGSCEIITTTKDPPRPKLVHRSPIDLTLNWFLRQINQNGQVNFSIDRMKKSCKTPRRNDDINAAISFIQSAYSFADQIINYFHSSIFNIPTKQTQGIDISSIKNAADQLFNPILPLFENIPNNPHEQKANEEKKNNNSKLTVQLNHSNWPLYPSLSVSDINLFLEEQIKSLNDKINDLSKVFTSSSSSSSPLLHYDQSILVLALHQIKSLSQGLFDGIEYIEDMIRKQLIAAVGKELTASDFNNYMKYHARKIYRSAYLPQSFSLSVRRPGLFPEGVLSIDHTPNDGGQSEPVSGLCRSVSSFPMYLSLNSSTRIQFNGDRHIHALLLNQFSGDSGGSLSLSARAKQFSSFMLCIGKIISPTEFQIKSSIIIQNKDDYRIPLLCETIPSAKEFRDAIESLSPEQQRFAKAYRSMQLQSSLFALLVIQIKPALEKVLNLPALSLVKEIQLTQDLLQLFIKYQIPPDQLSFDPLTDINVVHGSASSLGTIDESKIDANHKLDAVKKHVKDMLEMIKGAKTTQLEEIRQEADYAIEEEVQSSPDYFGGGPPMLLCASSSAAPKRTMMSFMAKSGSAAPRPTPSAAAPQKRSMAARKPAAAPSAPTGSGRAAPSKPSTSQSTSSSASSAPSNPPSDAGETEEDDSELPLDLTKIPSTLDSRLETFDEDGTVRPTILSTGSLWSKTSCASLLSDPQTTNVGEDEQTVEKNRSMDLLDALTRSGALSLDDCSLHVIMAATHCFDKSLINTIVQDNTNPIEKLERSSLIIATTIHQKNVNELVKVETFDAIQKYSAQKLIAQEQNALDAAK